VNRQLREEAKEAVMQCPYCKEEIIDGALKCKHCGSMINAEPIVLRPGGGNDFGAQFGRALELWKAHMGDLALLTLVFMLVVWIPIANLGFIAGYTRSLLRVSRGQGKAQIGDIFGAWDCFGNLLVFFVINLIAYFILHFIPVLGPLAALTLGFATVPGGYLIIDKGRSAIDAYKWCLETIQKDFVAWLLAYLVGTAIICASLVLFLVGVILGAPLGQLVIIQQYEAAAQGRS
jgi:hypothetical protein